MASHSQRPGLPVYVSFEAFKKALDWLKQDGLPQRFDESVWRRQVGSASYSAQMMAAFRFLGLVDSNQAPTETLEQLVFGSKSRPAILADVLRQQYPPLFQLDLESATPRQVEDALASLGVHGHTLRKAITFFVHACDFAEIHLSAFLTKPSRGSGTRKTSSSPEAGPATESGSRSDAVDALLDRLRRDGPTWTRSQRDLWFSALSAVVDLSYPTREE